MEQWHVTASYPALGWEPLCLDDMLHRKVHMMSSCFRDIRNLDKLGQWQPNEHQKGRGRTRVCAHVAYNETLEWKRCQWHSVWHVVTIHLDFQQPQLRPRLLLVFEGFENWNWNWTCARHQDPCILCGFSLPSHGRSRKLEKSHLLRLAKVEWCFDVLCCYCFTCGDGRSSLLTKYLFCTN